MLEIELHLYLSSLIISENIEALADIWFLGSDSIKEWFTSFNTIKLQAIENETAIPYLFQYYNLDVLYLKSTSEEHSYLAKVANALIHKLNEKAHLPHYIVIILDKDLIVNAKVFDFGARDVFEQTIRWLLNNVAGSINVHKHDLRKKHPGAVSASSEPRFVWVKALPRPEVLLAKSTYSLICKFNAALEDVLVQNRHSHIMKIDVPLNNQNFDRCGSITPLGLIHFWNHLDEQMKEFDRGKIDLQPYRYQRNQERTPDHTHNPQGSRYKWYKDKTCK